MQKLYRCCLPVAHGGEHMFIATKSAPMLGDCTAQPALTAYDRQKLVRKALNALAIRRAAAVLAEEYYSGARLSDLTPSQLADVMADATERVLS